MTQSIPALQKAVRVSKNGGILVDIPVPKPRDNEVLIKNEVVASNPKDWKHSIYTGADIVQGNDTVGTVVDIGKDVKNFKVGDHVVGFSPQSGTLGEGDRFGCFAQYTVVPEHTTFQMPANKLPEEVVTLPLAMLTSCIALFSHKGLGLPSPLSPSHTTTGTVVINGASSSIGSFAVQLAKLVGWRVIGIAGAGGKYAKSLGADAIIDYRGKSKDQLVKELQSHGSITHIYDCVSDLDSIEFLAKSLQPTGGTIATVIPWLPEDKVQQLLFENVVNNKIMVFDVFAQSHMKFGSEFCKWFPQALSENKICGNNYRVIPNGLEGVPEGLALLKDGKVSAEKLIYRINETPGLN